MNSKSKELTSGRWWRWTRYEVRAGSICPAPDAKLRVYDPWQKWQETRPVGRRAYQANDAKATPYDALFNMLRQLAYEKGVEADFKPAETDMLVGPLTADSEQKILDWCHQYGLLGILPHRTLQVTLGEAAGAQTQYTRMGVGWMATERRQDNPFAPLIKPNAAMRSLQGIGVSSESLLVTWARFFPDVTPNECLIHQYPEPLTEEFWKLYAEPLQDFLSAARALKGILSAIYLSQSRGRKIRDHHAAVTGGLLPIIDALVAPMGLGVQVNRNSRPSVHWVSTSLLSSLTTMLLEDLAKGTALRCPCGQLFVSNAYQARYHSKQCRWRFEKHKQRHPDED
jgi:hypothetical protein